MNSPKLIPLVVVLVLALLPSSPTLSENLARMRSGWVAVAPMQEARRGHSMVELPAGRSGRSRVIVIGGYDRDPVADNANANSLASCEIYDPYSNTWSYAAPHPLAAGFRWAVALNNGMVLVAGGWNSQGGNVPSAELTASHLYDPRTDRWITTGSLPRAAVNPHAFMRAVILRNGQVLIAGGAFHRDDDPELVVSRLSFVFTLNDRHPERSHWDYTRRASTHQISLMSDARTTSALLLLDNGRVLNVGGLNPIVDGVYAATNTSDLFDPRTGSWTRMAPMPPVFGLAGC